MQVGIIGRNARRTKEEGNQSQEGKVTEEQQDRLDMEDQTKVRRET